MGNVKSLINRHNGKTLRETNSKRDHNNCRDKNHAHQKVNVYSKTQFIKQQSLQIVKLKNTSDPQEDLSKTDGIHILEILKNEKNNETELSKYVWKLKTKPQTTKLNGT